MDTNFVKTITQRVYCFEFTIEQFKHITAKDWANLSERCSRADSDIDHAISLAAQLDKIDGACNVNYDNHFGPYIWVTIDCGDGLAATLRKVQATIKAYLS